MLNLDYVNKLIDQKTHIDVVDAADDRLIVDQYIKNDQPVKIRNMASNWKTDCWTPEYFRDQKGDLRFPVKRRSLGVSAEEEKEVSLAEFVDYMFENDINSEISPFYLNTNFSPTTDMLADYSVPTYFQCAFDSFRNRPDREPFSWIYLAPKNSVTDLHVDIIHSSAWNLVISGKKFWVFFPEEQTRYLYGGRVNPFAPDYDKHNLYSSAAPLVCVQKPGETVFTPSGWYHAVLNLTSGISLTENFINQHNFQKVREYCQANGIPTEELSARFEEEVMEF
jgi:histone arginine demethylase JMJD6